MLLKTDHHFYISGTIASYGLKASSNLNYKFWNSDAVIVFSSSFFPSPVSATEKINVHDY
jgi:hypothetical protein